MHALHNLDGVNQRDEIDSRMIHKNREEQSTIQWENTFAEQLAVLTGDTQPKLRYAAYPADHDKHRCYNFFYHTAPQIIARQGEQFAAAMARLDQNVCKQ